MERKMGDSMNHRLTSAARRWVLGAAFAAGLAAWLVPQSPDVVAAPAVEIIHVAQAETKAGKAAAKDPAKSAAAVEKPADDAAEDDPAAKDDTNITISPRGIKVDKGKKRVHVGAFGSDREYDSFQDFVQDAPWLAGLVFMTVSLVFLVPLLIIVLLIWYKVRKTRMMNETMIKLAEKGVVPPAEAMEALGANKVGAAVTAGPATAPLYEQAKGIRQRAAWSDLRKGVIMIAAGVGLSFWSMLDDGTANSVGLVLLFVGIGYCVLWFFEEREPAPRTVTSPPASGTPPPGGS
jgi:hypothetical protein